MRRRGFTAALAAGVALTAAGTAYAAFVTETGSPYAVGGGPYTTYAADFNADGLPDVATVNASSFTVSLFLRQAGGGFAPVQTTTTVDGSGGAVGDFNGDGVPDLAVAGFTSGGVGVLLGHAGGGFTVEGTTPLNTRLEAVAAGDFDHDGKVDLAVSRYDGASVSILLRNSTNDGFTTGRVYQVGTNPGEIAVGDFNGDGWADLAVANASSGNVSILLNARDSGAFTPEGNVAVGTNPARIVSADFNGDGHADFAVTNYTDHTVSVMLRNAANTGFENQAGSPIAVGAAPEGIALADTDANGVLDLAVAVQDAVDVLRGTGSGFVLDPATPLAGANYGIAAADFDRNGRTDLAVSDIVGNTMSVLLNPAPAIVTPTPTPTATPTPLPPPVAGKLVDGSRKSGTVKFRRPGSKMFVTLTADAQIPVGSTIDTRKGRITLTVAQEKGKTASADFFDGLFKLAQTKGSKPATTLTLTEALSCPKAKKASAAAAKKKKTRKLWGSGHGRFTTKGSYSAATVRGTEWLVQDSCTTTTTRVKKGVVAVRDNVKHKTVIVRAGKRYVARAKKR